MKTSITKLKTSLFLITLTLSSVSFAKVVAKVTEVKGNVFAVLPDGKTVKVTPNLHLEEKSEILVAESGSATFYDFYDTTYHLNSTGHIKILDRSVHLKGGKVWIQSTHASSPLSLITANTYIDYWKSEFITSFDQVSGKSQVMVVGGDLDVSNILDRNLKYSLTAGAFTVIDPDVNEGQPRQPTSIGPESMTKAMAEFKSIPKSILNKETPAMKRSIASVDESAATKKGEIIFIKTNRAPASVMPKSLKAKSSVSGVSGPVPVRVIGVFGPVTPKLVAPSLPKVDAVRVPASAQPAVMIHDVDFNQSLDSAIDKQPKYPSEVQKLVDDLKSF